MVIIPHSSENKRGYMAKNYTVIDHDARKSLGISFTEFAVADEIYHLSNNETGWCYKTKENIAERFGISRRSVHSAINALIEAGLVERHSETKHLRTTQKWYETVIFTDSEDAAHSVQKLHTDSAKVAHEHSAKVAHKSNSIENNNKNTVTDVTVGAEAPPGKPEINEMFDLWGQVVGIPISSKIKANRFAASNLLKKHGHDKVVALIRGVAEAQQDAYAPRIADFCQLQSKLTDLLVWGRQRQNQSSVVSV